jgi:hypothetical protein
MMRLSHGSVWIWRSSCTNMRVAEMAQLPKKHTSPSAPRGQQQGFEQEILWRTSRQRQNSGHDFALSSQQPVHEGQM